MTRKITLLSLFFVSAFVMTAQNKVNLIIFSEDSDPFFVFINGVQQNTKAESNVKFTDLSPNVSLRIKFEDIALPEIKKSMPLEANMEHTFRIKKDVNKQVKLRYFGGVPLSEAATGMTTIAYHTAPDGEVSAPPVSNNTNANTQGNTTTIHSSTVITSNTQVNPNASTTDQVNVNINMAGVGMSMNVSGMDQSNQTSMNSSSSTTISSHTSSSHSGNTEQKADNAGTPVKTQAATCQTAMSPANFNKMKESIDSKPFSETKMSTAKVATKNACLSVKQIKEVVGLFSMDEDKLAYAKYAYAFCVDKANYYQVGDVFSFSASTEELNEFLSEK